MMILDTEEQLLKYISKNDNLYIYGGGAIANLLAKRLRRYHVEWRAFLTTNGTEKVDGTDAVKFRDIAEILQKSCALVIVATKEVFHEEIERLLNEQSITNAAFLSGRLISAIERITGAHFKFQTHIVEHCNLKCQGCYHFSSLAKEEYLSVEEYGRDIQRIGKLFHGSLDEILLLGGEPLLHPQIAEFFYLTREAVPDCQIKILTNGLKLCTMNEDFWEALREEQVQLWVTKYPVAFDYDKAEQIAQEHGSEIFYFNREPVRTTGYQPINLEGNRDYMNNWRSCYRANECVDLKYGKMFPCIIPAEIKTFNEYFGQNLQICEQDYVDIYEVETGMELMEKLECPMPFCRYCSRENISIFGDRPWKQTKYDMKEWIE